MPNLRITVLAMVAIFSAISVLLAVAEPVANETSEVIFSVPWGDKPGQIGLINEPEQEICGPLSFSTDGRNVFILDGVHRQIISINPDGKAEVMASNVVGSSLCATDNGELFVQDGQQILHIERSGKIKDRYRVVSQASSSPKLIEGYGMEMFLDADGYLCVRGLNQQVHRVFGAPPMRANASSGHPDSRQPLQYKIKRMSGNEVRIIGLDAEGKVLVSVPVCLDGGQAGAVLFKGTDAKGNLYVEVENQKGNKPGLEVHRYSRSGKRLRVFQLPNDYFTTVYKKTEITAEGAVYQLLTTADGARIIRY